MNSTSAVQIIMKALSALSATAGAAITRPGSSARDPRAVLIVNLFIFSIPITVCQELLTVPLRQIRPYGCE
ncbi:hypothetical protein D3C74_455710 [compost metagenome]